MHTYKTLVALLVLFTAQIAVHADTVYLTDGTKREGTVVEDEGNSVKLLVKHGPLTATVEIPRKEVARVEIKALAVNEDDLNFQILGKEAERLATLDAAQGAQAWLRYAKFCEAKTGYSGFAKNGYENALQCDPDLAEARIALGYQRNDEGWFKPKVEESTYIARRFVPYQAPYSAVSPSYVTPEIPAVQPETYSTQVQSRSNYSRDTYYTEDYGYRNPVIYLGSVNGRLQPVSASQFWYGNNNSNCNTNSNTGYVQTGRTGYLSDGYYRSNSNGVSTYVSGNTVAKPATGTSGSYTTPTVTGTNAYMSGTTYKTPR